MIAKIINKISNSDLSNCIFLGRTLVFFSLITLLFFLPDWRLTYGFFYMGKFATTKGVITESSVRYFPKSGKWDTSKFCPIIEYRYSVGASHYTSILLSFSQHLCGSKEKCIGYTNQYPINRVVTVYYVPTHPEIAALDPYTKDWAHAGALALPLFSILIIGSLIFSLWAKHELRKRNRGAP
jgi:hypothetical protein